MTFEAITDRATPFSSYRKGNTDLEFVILKWTAYAMCRLADSRWLKRLQTGLHNQIAARLQTRLQPDCRHRLQTRLTLDSSFVRIPFFPADLDSHLALGFQLKCSFSII